MAKSKLSPKLTEQRRQLRRLYSDNEEITDIIIALTKDVNPKEVEGFIRGSRGTFAKKTLAAIDLAYECSANQGDYSDEPYLRKEIVPGVKVVLPGNPMASYVKEVNEFEAAVSGNRKVRLCTDCSDLADAIQAVRKNTADRYGIGDLQVLNMICATTDMPESMFYRAQQHLDGGLNIDEEVADWEATKICGDLADPFIFDDEASYHHPIGSAIVDFQKTVSVVIGHEPNNIMTVYFSRQRFNVNNPDKIILENDTKFFRNGPKGNPVPEEMRLSNGGLDRITYYVRNGFVPENGVSRNIWNIIPPVKSRPKVQAKRNTA